MTDQFANTQIDVHARLAEATNLIEQSFYALRDWGQAPYTANALRVWLAQEERPVEEVKP